MSLKRRNFHHHQPSHLPKSITEKTVAKRIDTQSYRPVRLADLEISRQERGRFIPLSGSRTALHVIIRSSFLIKKIKTQGKNVK
jgi:hypothetical protein